MINLIYSVFGIFFGIVLTKAEVISWFRIQAMFQFKEPHMYLIIGSAVVTGAIIIRIFKILNVKSVNGEALDFTPKPFHKGFIIGGIIFGIGWAITGACPGPIYAQVGTGAYPAVITLAGAIFGAYLYHALKKYLPH
jgi:hypothetical protein